MSEMERDERNQAEDDAKEDLELKDEDADQVRGGATFKYSGSTSVKAERSARPEARPRSRHARDAPRTPGAGRLLPRTASTGWFATTAASDSPRGSPRSG